MLLSGVIGLASRAQNKVALSASFGAFDTALQAGSLPATGKVSDRLVRAAFASLERANASLRIDHIPNPLPAPHNLSWYFGACACQDDVRAFATMLGRKNIRVWSVAKTNAGSVVLAQVFGVSSPHDAVKVVETEVKGPTTRLKNHTLGAISSFTLFPAQVEGLHDYARGLLKGSLGTFVQVSLDRRSP